MALISNFFGTICYFFHINWLIISEKLFIFADRNYKYYYIIIKCTESGSNVA
jgi:hypothetical protein